MQMVKRLCVPPHTPHNVNWNFLRSRSAFAERSSVTRLQLITNGAQRITPIRYTLILQERTHEFSFHYENGKTTDSRLCGLVRVCVWACASARTHRTKMRRPNREQNGAFIWMLLAHATATIRVAVANDDFNHKAVNGDALFILSHTNSTQHTHTSLIRSIVIVTH